MSGSETAIYVSSVANAGDSDSLCGISDFVDDPVIADTDAIPAIGGEFSSAVRAWFCAEIRNGFKNPATDR